MKFDNQRVLIVAPHQDDETIGCGGIIQKYLQVGSSVRVIFSTRMEKVHKKYNKSNKEYIEYTGDSRTLEMLEALKVLGIDEKNVDYLYDYKYHSKLDQISCEKRLDKLEKEIEQFKPTVIFFPAVSSNQDHEEMHRTVMSAIRPHFYNGNVIEYEISHEFDFKPNLYIKLTREELDNKLKALECYRTQNSGRLHKVSLAGVENRAIYRGYDVYTDYAEAFFVRRYVAY